MPITIDGTTITGATIDGQQVKQITMDGDVVWPVTFADKGITDTGSNYIEVSNGRLKNGRNGNNMTLYGRYDGVLTGSYTRVANGSPTGILTWNNNIGFTVNDGTSRYELEDPNTGARLTTLDNSPSSRGIFKIDGNYNLEVEYETQVTEWNRKRSTLSSQNGFGSASKNWNGPTGSAYRGHGVSFSVNETGGVPYRVSWSAEGSGSDTVTKDGGDFGKSRGLSESVVANGASLSLSVSNYQNVTLDPGPGDYEINSRKIKVFWEARNISTVTRTKDVRMI